VNNIHITRRNLLKKSAILGASALVLPNQLLANTSKKSHRLNLYNPKVNQTFYPRLYTETGKLDIRGLFELDKALMDFREYEITRINFKLAKLLYKLNSHIGFDRRIVINSGYRTPKTNQRLRRYTRGVAKHSYHLKGMAVDVHIPGMRMHKMKDIIKGINPDGGVGYYPNSGFMHMDVGPQRHWSSYV